MQEQETNSKKDHITPNCDKRTIEAISDNVRSLFADLEELGMLESTESLDGMSSDSSPESIPGVSAYSHLQFGIENRAGQPWNRPLNIDDITKIQHYSILTQKQLFVEIKRLYNMAYTIGIEESKEMTRGKYLNVLGRDDKDFNSNSYFRQ